MQPKFQPKFPVIFWSLAGLSGVYYILLVFSQMPFLQAEELGIAYEFAWSGRGFWDVFFDPYLMDGGPGRFRFLEYLVQGLYWKATKSGILPKELYDWLSMGVNLAISMILLLGVGVLQKWQRWQRLIAALIFIYGAPIFFVTLFHFRPAKVLTSLWVLLYLCSRNENRLSKTRTGLLILGVLTDPYAALILTLAVGLDTWREKSMVRVREWGFMAVVMAIVVFTLNGWIGPKINPLVSLWLSDTPSLGENYFSWKSIFEAPLILSDLVGVRGSGGLRWGAGLVFWSSLAIFLGRRGVQKTNRFATLFFWSLPLFAFAVLPSSNPIQLFSTYYGHTAYLLLAIAASELLLLTYQKVLLRRIAAFLTVGLLFSQTTLAVPLYQNWVFDHLQGRRPEVWMKYARDYQEYLGPDALPVTWPEEGKEAVLASYRDEKGRYLNATIDGDGKFAHTAIAYLLR